MKSIALVFFSVSLIFVAYLVVERRGVVSSAEPAAQTGRYQAEMVGSRGPQRFAVTFLHDTVSGKTWQTRLFVGYNEGWTEVAEPDGKDPGSPGDVGTYRISAAMVSDRTGQEVASATRVDTRTGKTWVARSLPPPPAWVAVPEPGKAPAPEEKK